MKSQFSESQFAFALLHEIVGILPPTQGWCPLRMPTQQEENDCGYDCFIKKNGDPKVHGLYLQFKRSDYLSRSTAKYWSDFNGPYYLFHIWPAKVSPQHNLLVTLANTNASNHVYYCAPVFSTESDFNNYYSQSEVKSHTIFVNCKKLPMIATSDEKHNVCFTSPQYYIMHSETYRGDGYDYHHFISNLLDNPYPGLPLSAFTEMLEKQLGFDHVTSENTKERLQFLSQFLFVHYGIFLMLYQN